MESVRRCFLTAKERSCAVGFTTVLDTQDDLFRAQLRLAQLISDYGADRAQLAAVVGEEWYK